MSEIDRLIELASDEQAPASILEGKSRDFTQTANNSLSLEDKKDPAPSMWRLLLQMRVLLPYLSRVLPLLERGVLGTNVLSSSSGAPPKLDTSVLERDLGEIRASQRELNLQLKNQTGDIKFLQEQLTWLSKSIEQETLRQQEIVDGLEALRKTVRTWFVALLITLLALIGVVLFVSFRAHS